MTVKMRYSPAMRGITVAAAAVALTMTATGTASAWHVPWGHHRHQAAATAPAVGRCGDLCSPAVSHHKEGGVFTGVDIELANYNDHPVRVRWQAWRWVDYPDSGPIKCDDGSGENPGADPCLVETVRVPAHSTRVIGFVSWQDATTIFVGFTDAYNGRELGSVRVDKP